VLCPNASLESIAIRPPGEAADLEGRKDLKQWFARAFGGEIAELLAAEGAAQEKTPS
jgi:hypothetical protein